MSTTRSAWLVVGGVAFAILVGSYRLLAAPEPAAAQPMDPPVVLAESAAPVTLAAASPRAALVEMARRNPEALPKLALEQYDGRVDDYTCVFWKQERIDGKLRKLEKIRVSYRDEPVSVFMRWEQNADQVKRALFVDHPSFVNDKGEKIAKVEPAGAIIRLLVSEVELPIHGERAREASRSTMDRFGFRRMLELLLADNALASRQGVLDFRYEGEGEIDGRPTYVLVRYLPYEGEDGLFQNAKMTMHIDQEWLLPTAVYCYADKEGRTLLSSYVFTDVKLNPGLTDQDFKF